jgi:hypothetical protein
VNVEAERVGDAYRCKSPGRIRISLQYRDWIQNNNGVFDLWLDASCNLQRLDLTDCPFDVEVIFTTPQHASAAAPDQPTSNLHRLRDAARETHMTFMEKWFPDHDVTAPLHGGCRTSNGAVEHEAWSDGNKAAWDEVTLRVRELGEERLIVKPIDEIRRCLTRWRHYQDDVIFDWEYGSPEQL